MRPRNREEEAMKERLKKRRSLLNSYFYSHPFSSSSWRLAFFVLVPCALFFVVAFSTFRIFGVSFRPVLISTWQTPAMRALSSEQPLTVETNPNPPSIQIQEAISFPDSILIFIKHPLTTLTSDLGCLYFSPSSRSPNLRHPSLSTSTRNLFIRCPLAPQGSSISLSLSPSLSLPPVQPLNWDHLAYSAVLDHRDNTTVVFAKGFNLRSGRMIDPNRYECVFGWEFGKPNYRLTTAAISAAQEVFRCKTPLSVLNFLSRSPVNAPLVSVKTKGRGSIILPTVAHPVVLSPPRSKKKHKMCVCTMVRNQARFVREWIGYHSRIGVERWFIYDNNSDDDIEQVVSSMNSVSLHEWPWVKTQEAGFSHCALRARDSCEWVGFIDVDEFLYLPSNITLHDVLQNFSSKPWIGELRTDCHSFGPSGKKEIPAQGVVMGYTCRMASPERHKSIVRPDALNTSLINIVHHFHLRDGVRYENIESRTMVINHYKYQVWEVFKEKFYRRVATYVSDWQDEENVGSKDRAPGLGTKPEEPPDWSSRFCEVNDTGLRNWVQRVLVNQSSGLLPW